MIAFVRHGETAPNVQGLLLGRNDPGLTSRGQEQARMLGEVTRRLEPERVLSSPLARARETAAAIAAASGLSVEVDERLIEIEYGEWEGRPFAALGRGVVAQWRRDADFAPPGGESLRVVEERVGRFCDDRLDDEVVVAVSHVSPIKAAVTWAIGVGPEIAWRMRVAVASITRIAPGPVLLTFNETVPAAP